MEGKKKQVFKRNTAATFDPCFRAEPGPPHSVSLVCGYASHASGPFLNTFKGKKITSTSYIVTVRIHASPSSQQVLIKELSFCT